MPRSFPASARSCKQPPGRAHIPVVRVKLVARQGQVALAREIDLHRLRLFRKLIL